MSEQSTPEERGAWLARRERWALFARLDEHAVRPYPPTYNNQVGPELNEITTPSLSGGVDLDAHLQPYQQQVITMPRTDEEIDSQNLEAITGIEYRQRLQQLAEVRNQAAQLYAVAPYEAAPTIPIHNMTDTLPPSLSPNGPTPVFIDEYIDSAVMRPATLPGEITISASGSSGTFDVAESNPETAVEAVNPERSVSAVVGAPSEVAPEDKRVARWVVLYGGTPVSAFEDLIKMTDDPDLEATPEQLKVVWDARFEGDPEKAIEAIIDLNPVLASMMDYTCEVVNDGVNMELVGKSEKSIADIIIKATAGILLRGGLSDKFEYRETGELVINSSNPPDVTEGNELLRRILDVKETGQKIDNYSAWTLGMICDQLENYFGDRFDPTDVMEATNTSYHIYTTALNTFRNYWSIRRKNLTFTHHKEVFYSSITEVEKQEVLDLSSRLNLSVAVQRKVITYVRIYGFESLNDPVQSVDLIDEDGEPVQVAEISDKETLMERIEVKSVNKNFMFFLPAQKKWYKFRGPYELIPSHASIIFNSDTRTIVDANGPKPMDEWTPAPVVAPADT